MLATKNGGYIEYSTPNIVGYEDQRPAIKLFEAFKKKDAEILYDSEKGMKKREVLRIRSTVLSGAKSSGSNNKDDFLLDMSLIRHASKDYCISPDFRDYILKPVITVPTGLPNRNGVAFPLDQLLAWNGQYGDRAYKTFRGKPVYIEHDNMDFTKSQGIIIDSHLKQLNGYSKGKVWKFLELLAIDRTKSPEVASSVLKNDINSFSMGALVANYRCSKCRSEIGTCPHLNINSDRDFYLDEDDHLIFREVTGIAGFETSIVKDPAFFIAVSDVTL